MNIFKLRNKKINIFKVFIIDSVVICFFIFLTVVGMFRYEQGIIDVCATQQDGYVKLVIDQINLRANRTDKEIIEGILNTLDSSSNRYWTFSKGQEMLYVKDTLETNRYKSVTADSYYDSDTATVFLDGLVFNRVKHARIELDGKDYIASGSLFEYGGKQYRICLLTNVSVLLDNNMFLGSKTEFIILFCIVYVCLYVCPLITVMMHNNFFDVHSDMADEIYQMGHDIEQLNEKLSVDEIYDNRQSLFQFPVVNRFVDRYKDRRDAFPISFLAYRYGERDTVADFFGRNSVAFGQKDIKFYDGKQHLVLILSVQCSRTNAKELAAITKGGSEFLGSCTAEYPEVLESSLLDILKIMGNPSMSPLGLGTRADSRTEGRYRNDNRKDDDMDAKVVKEIDDRISSLEEALLSHEDSSGEVSHDDLLLRRVKRLEQRLDAVVDMKYELDWLKLRLKDKVSNS